MPLSEGCLNSISSHLNAGRQYNHTIYTAWTVIITVLWCIEMTVIFPSFCSWYWGDFVCGVGTLPSLNIHVAEHMDKAECSSRPGRLCVWRSGYWSVRCLLRMWYPSSSLPNPVSANYTNLLLFRTVNGRKAGQHKWMWSRLVWPCEKGIMLARTPMLLSLSVSGDKDHISLCVWCVIGRLLMMSTYSSTNCPETHS